MLLLALGRTRLLFAALLAVLSLFAVSAWAQVPEERIREEINNSERATIRGSHPSMARAENDAGRIPGQTRLEGMSIVFSRTAAQEADLQSLIAAQQNPSSPLYQKWLTPEEFAARFGIADADVAKVRLWLQQEGFSIVSISRSRNRITFSGTVGQAEAAFGTELHYYNVNGKKEYAPATDISIPVALSSVVSTVTNLSTFRPKPHLKLSAPQPRPTANFTSGQSGNHYLTPGDIATIYDINPAYNSGLTGVGQSLAVVGQSSIVLTDIEHFQTAAGLTAKDPTLVLVPNSGSAVIVSGDESESDLDLEYSGGIARGATIYFVYTGNSTNYSVWDALTYAIDNKTAPVISISYGTCETALSASEYSMLNGVLAQAASQGQSVIAASGDGGSTDCQGFASLTTAQQQALAVDFPASSQYVTGMGGTEFSAADVAVGNTTYWKSNGTSDVISSALSYTPEQVWNDDSSTFGLSSGGGGVSTLTPKPSWQTGVPGIPSGSNRFVPDISLTASPNNAGFLYCSSDSATGVTGSCSNGFRDSSNTNLTVAGGTSFDAPIFAGMLAILNQKLNSSGQGVANTTLYTLAANSTTYASGFHDITSGGNQCTAGTKFCSTAGASEYPATTGYDEASGLGSVDFYNLLSAWPTSGSTPVVTTTTLSAATTTPASGANDAITIKVASASSSSTATPTGTLTIAVDGATVPSSLALASGTATYTFSSTIVGSHTITATYSGDTNYAPSGGTLTVTIAALPKSFTLSAASATISTGTTGTSVVTITPQNGYTGTIGWSVSSSPSISNACFSLPNATVSDSSAVSATLTIRTSGAACASGAVIGTQGNMRRTVGAGPVASRREVPRTVPSGTTQASLGLAGLLLVGIIGFRFRKLGMLAGVFLLVAVGFSVGGCASTSSTPAPVSSNAPRGTYTVTIVGTDTATATITASTTMTLVID
jgi:hypothetical protein